MDSDTVDCHSRYAPLPLLLEENLTLDKALTIIYQVEAAVKNATLLSSAGMVLTAPVQAVSMTHFRGKRGAQLNFQHQTVANRQMVTNKCFACYNHASRVRAYLRC